MKLGDPHVLSPYQLIDPLWRGASAVMLTTIEARRVLLHYGTKYVHVREDVGHRLVVRHIGAGVYEAELEPMTARDGGGR